MSALGVEEFDVVFRVDLPPRPYPGLRPFEKEEWPIFFGRERMADAVVAQLIGKRLLVVHGDSGCGKSSLVRAGVLPRLEQENARGGIRWRTCVAMPREAPLWNLAQTLAGIDGGPPDEARVIEIRRVLNFGRAAPGALAKLLRRSPDDQVCILIDQFEELFDHARRHGPDEAQALTEILVGLFAEPPEGLYAVLTMRSEFLGACARFRGFAETVNATQYLLPRMDHGDLLRAIHEPAALYGGEVSLALAERLIADSGGGQDQLPLIQHGLMLLHRDRAGARPDLAGLAETRATWPQGTGPAWRLGLEDYGHEGGLAGLLSDHADAVMLEAERAHQGPVDPARVVEDLFRALTDINAEGQAIRRPRTLAQLVAVTGADEATLRGIVDDFRADGVSFLKPHGSEPIDVSELVDVSHEALIRCWRKIAELKDGWLIREFRNGLVWRALVVQAESFERSPANVLGPAIADERERWLRRRTPTWAERYGGGWERVQKLIEASVASAAEVKRQEQERLIAEERAKRQEVELQAVRELAAAEAAKRRRTFQALVATVALALVSIGLGAFAWHQTNLAREEAKAAAEALYLAETNAQAAMAARAKAEEELRRGNRALASAAEVQASAAQTIASTLSRETAGDPVTEVLHGLSRTTDPYEIAVLAQSLAGLTQSLTPEQARTALLSLIVALQNSTDPNSAIAIARAITALAPLLPPADAVGALSEILDIISQMKDPDLISALVQAIAAFAPRLPGAYTTAAMRELLNAAGQTTGPDSTIALIGGAALLAPSVPPEQLRLLAEELAPDRVTKTLLELRAFIVARGEDVAAALQPLISVLSTRAALPQPRLYIQISEEAQRGVARRLELELEDVNIFGDPLVVPGIELVRGTISRSAVRCFRALECQTDGPRLVDAVNRLLREPQVVLEDLRARYGAATNIRPRHYELWFAPGEIRLRPAQAE